MDEQVSNVTAMEIANAADVAAPSTAMSREARLLRAGCTAWLAAEQRDVTRADRTGALTAPQRKVLEHALSVLVVEASRGHWVSVTATTSQVKTILADIENRARASDVFLGWKHRLMPDGDGSRMRQSFDENGETFYVALAVVDEGYGARRITAAIHEAVPGHDTFEVGIAITPPTSSTVPLTYRAPASDDAGPDDPVTSASARTLYEALKLRSRERARRFLTWCKNEGIQLWNILLRPVWQPAVAIPEVATAAESEVQQGVSTVVSTTEYRQGSLALAAARSGSQEISSVEELNRRVRALEREMEGTMRRSGLMSDEGATRDATWFAEYCKHTFVTTSHLPIHIEERRKEMISRFRQRVYFVAVTVALILAWLAFAVR